MNDQPKIFCLLFSDRTSPQHTRKQRVHSRDHVRVLQCPRPLHCCSGKTAAKAFLSFGNKSLKVQTPALTAGSNTELRRVSCVRISRFVCLTENVIPRMFYGEMRVFTSPFSKFHNLFGLFLLHINAHECPECKPMFHDFFFFSFPRLSWRWLPPGHPDRWENGR